MIPALIEWSLRNRVIISLTTIILCVLGWRALISTPVDAIPDLSDIQVIVKTHYPGQSPRVVEDQVTRPLSTALMAVPGANTVRGFSFFGDSYIYIIFDDDTDIYWARSRVLEYLNQVKEKLPSEAKPQLGPDASGVGWVYIYALQDTTGQHDLGQLRAIQDWFLGYELQAIPGVSEVAPVGGMIKQYQIILDPQKLLHHKIPIEHVRNTINRNNRESGASVIELAEAEYMLRATGYIKNKADILNISLGLNQDGTPLYIRQVAKVLEVPSMRRGVAELNGEGETVGGIIVMRHGENAQQVIERVKTKIKNLEKSLPKGLEIIPVYDRSTLITRAVSNLWHKVVEELLLVGAVIFLFLFSFRSVLVAMITLPIGILISFLIMQIQGVNANIMSLGGIAIAIGAMIDGAIVMIENLHKKIAGNQHNQQPRTHFAVVLDSAKEVGPTLFFSLLIITVSFMPVFTLEAEEGRLFTPLALTKTYAMGAAAILSITLVPVLLFLFVRRSHRLAQHNPVTQKLLSFYQPLLRACLSHPKMILISACGFIIVSIIPLTNLSSEFMPPLDEGDLMYMPTTHPGISIGKARELLQQTDKIILTVPEVDKVFGKVGRADTATDPAPLTMIETFIQLKPKSEWRKGVTTESIIDELEQKVKFPGLTNAWVMPIKTRIDMLSTGMKTPLGIKLAGADINQLQSLGQKLEKLLGQLPQTQSVYAERSAGGRYLTLDIDRFAIARFGVDLQDVQQAIQLAIGGMAIGEVIQGAERYPVSLRYPTDYRSTPSQLSNTPLVLPNGKTCLLGDLASIQIDTGAPMLKSENARLNTWLFLDIGNSDIQSYVADAEKIIRENIQWPAGYSLRWAGQYESLERVRNQLNLVIPLTLISIALLLYLNFSRISDVIILMASLPFALVGGLVLVALLDFRFSVAVAVGFIALAGLAVETSAIMLQVLRSNITPMEGVSEGELKAKVAHYASQRMRPVLMTAAATVAGLMPIMFGHEPGSEVMSRIAAPVIGGLATSVILTLFLLPCAYYLLMRRYFFESK